MDVNLAGTYRLRQMLGENANTYLSNVPGTNRVILSDTVDASVFTTAASKGTQRVVTTGRGSVALGVGPFGSLHAGDGEMVVIRHLSSVCPSVQDDLYVLVSPKTSAFLTLGEDGLFFSNSCDAVLGFALDKIDSAPAPVKAPLSHWFVLIFAVAAFLIFSFWYAYAPPGRFGPKDPQ